MILICAAMLLTASAGLADEKRYEFLLSRLDAKISVDVQEAPLPILLTTLEDSASLPGFEKDPAKKVTILVNEKQFKEETAGAFDLDKLAAIRLPPRLNLPLSSVLQMICEQLDGVFVVGKDFIEIVPVFPFRRDLGIAEDDRRNLMPLVHCNFKKVAFSKAVEELADKYHRSVVLSTLIAEQVPSTEITAKLANVPFETAIELLAACVDLKVIAKGEVFFVTTKEQAAELIREKQKREAAKKTESSEPAFPSNGTKQK
jgi:hypothetical protein